MRCFCFVIITVDGFLFCFYNGDRDGRVYAVFLFCGGGIPGNFFFFFFL
jgi:hypothetical protein